MCFFFSSFFGGRGGWSICGPVSRLIRGKPGQFCSDFHDISKHDFALTVQFNDQSFKCRKMKCPVVGCKAKLNGLKDLETHFFSRHTAVCSVCSRVFPTSRLLDLHIAESHDSFFQAKVAHGHPMVYL